MPVCTFWGHGDCPDSVRPQIKEAVLTLIEHGVHDFFVGCNGNFDRLVRSVLMELSLQQKNLRYDVVLAYLDKNASLLYEQGYPTIFPEGIEKIPPRYAISWRNSWMLSKADYAICYVKYTWGGAAQFRKKAIKKGLKIIDLA